MTLLVLGICGKRGSGKDTVANYLKEKYGFNVLTYTDDVTAPILREKGLPETRENMIKLVIELREEQGLDILTKMICKKIRPDGLWVVSGVRLLEEVEYFRAMYGENFKLVAVKCEAKKRYERLAKRGTKGEGDMNYNEFLEVDRKPTEIPIVDTMDLANFTLDNNKTPYDLFLQIDCMAENMKLQSNAHEKC